MKTIRFIIDNNEIDVFRKACYETSGITFLGMLNDGRLEIEYDNDFALFYLGRMMQIEKTLENLK